MTGGSPPHVRTFGFGDLDTGIWGVAAAWGAGAGAVSSFATTVAAHTGDVADEWFLAADGLELRFAPLSDPAPLRPASAGIEGYAQLCAVEGAIHRGSSEQEVSCLGARGSVSLPTAAVESARAASAWFGPEYAFALASLRAPRAAGHDRDAVACAILEDGVPLTVDEPRLSTTYDAAGASSRASLEVWLADVEVEGEEPRPQYPRRLAGEATGERAHLKAPGLEVQAELFRWRGRGLEGAGVYVLVERK
jgi:hypothetical protein